MKPVVGVYIDGANLHRAAQELGFTIDYKLFRDWLREKYHPTHVYLFIGYLPQNTHMYQTLKECGFTLVFKETVAMRTGTKGNCDTELAITAVSDFYTNTCSKFIIVSGDGDFSFLVRFLREHTCTVHILAPHKKKCSYLLRKSGALLTFLNDHYHKFSRTNSILQNEKAPDEAGTS